MVVMASTRLLSSSHSNSNAYAVVPPPSFLRASPPASLCRSRSFRNAFCNSFGRPMDTECSNSDLLDRKLARNLRSGAPVPFVQFAHTNPVSSSLADTFSTASMKEEGGMVRRALLRKLQANYFGGPWFHGVESCQAEVQKRLPSSLSKTDEGFSSENADWSQNIGSFQQKIASVFKSYPWGTLCQRFLERSLDLVWIPAKWLAIPVLLLSTVNELLYALSVNKEIFILLGVLAGFLLAKTIGGAAVEVMKEIRQDGTASWPLLLLAFLFLLLKLSGPYLPSWAAVFVPSMANTGLVKIFFQYRELQQPSLF